MQQQEDATIFYIKTIFFLLFNIRGGRMIGQIADIRGASCFRDAVERVLCSGKSDLGLVFLSAFQRVKTRMSNRRRRCSAPTDQGTASSG